MHFRNFMDFCRACGGMLVMVGHRAHSMAGQVQGMVALGTVTSKGVQTIPVMRMAAITPGTRVNTQVGVEHGKQ